MGTKKLSNEQEQIMVQEYISGIPVKDLMAKYGFATKKSITDKVKKHLGDDYDEAVARAKANRKGYEYTMEKLNSPFDAYFLGLLLTDGYVTTRGTDIGIDLIDEDCISFLAKAIGKDYKTYKSTDNIRQDRHRLIVSSPTFVENIKRFGIVQNKTLTLQPPQLLPEEEKYIPYIIRGIIDGDGCVTPTSYGAPSCIIYTASKEFADWIVYILENKMYMIDIRISSQDKGTGNLLWRVETSNINNIEKLLALTYDKPFGMNKKYDLIRQTFRDYNNSAFIQNKG